MVALRVAEELEKRKDEIEAEVLRRVEQAKQLMEQQMLEELERRRKERLEEENRREVWSFTPRGSSLLLLPYHHLLAVHWMMKDLPCDRFHQPAGNKENRNRAHCKFRLFVF